MILGGVLLVGSVTTVIVIRHQRKKKLNCIYSALGLNEGDGGGQYGDERDLEGSSAFDVNFWRSWEEAMLADNALRARIVKAADDIWDSKDPINDDEAKVYAAFERMRSKAEVSMMASYFNDKRKRSLYTYLESFLSADERQKVQDIVNRKERTLIK